MRTCDTVCPNCGAGAPVSLFENCDYISNETFPIVQCRNCKYAWTELQNRDIELADYYGPSYYGESGQRFPSIVESAIYNFRSRRANALGRLFAQPGRVLDIGCGRALTLSMLKERGWQCIGTELSEELASLARLKLGIQVFTNPLLTQCEFAAESFDLITMYHVLEHVQDPMLTLAEVHRILKPGGILLVEVPNFESWQARMAKGKWFHLDTPRHLWHFGKPVLATVLRSKGFAVQSNSTRSAEYGYYGLWQSILNIAAGQMNVVYAMLKRVQPVGHRKVRLRAAIANIVLAIPAAIISIPLEVLSIAFGHGGVIKLVVTKNTIE